MVDAMTDGHQIAFEVAGASLCGERWGDRGPAVVFLHAGVADRRSWYGVAESLSGLGRLVAYDRRGYGRSALGRGDFSHLTDLLAVLDQVDSKPVWLVGSSMGGGLALDCAIARPERIAGLVLLAPAVSGWPDEKELDEAATALMQRLDEAAAGDDVETANRLEVWLWLDGPAGPEGRVGGEARQLALSMNRIILANDDDEDAGGSGVDAFSRLEEVRMPVTVACGDRDLPALMETSRYLASHLPGARLVTLTGMAHLPYLEDSRAVADVIRSSVLGPAVP